MKQIIGPEYVADLERKLILSDSQRKKYQKEYRDNRDKSIISYGVSKAELDINYGYIKYDLSSATNNYYTYLNSLLLIPGMYEIIQECIVDGTWKDEDKDRFYRVVRILKHNTVQNSRNILGGKREEVYISEPLEERFRMDEHSVFEMGDSRLSDAVDKVCSRIENHEGNEKVLKGILSLYLQINSRRIQRGKCEALETLQKYTDGIRKTQSNNGRIMFSFDPSITISDETIEIIKKEIMKQGRYQDIHSRFLRNR